MKQISIEKLKKKHCVELQIEKLLVKVQIEKTELIYTKIINMCGSIMCITLCKVIYPTELVH